MTELLLASDALVDDDEISDDELVALALAGDPDQPVAADAVPIALGPDSFPGMLPQWYMPATTVARLSGWRSPLVLAVVIALVVIDALGLCATYGQVVLA